MHSSELVYQKAHAKFSEVIDKARKSWPKFTIDVSLEILPNMGRYAGLAFPHKVQLNRQFIIQSEEFANDTIAHEIAHVVCFYFGWDRGHGKNWRRVASMLGANPRATFSAAKTGVNIRYKRKVTAIPV
jgi:predicted SprT family Zn-dependent metalloprotease